MRYWAPVIWICRQQTCPAFDAFVRFGELLHRGRAFADNHIAGPNGIVRNFTFVEGREDAAFANHKNGAAWIGLAQKVGCIQSGGVKMLRRQTLNSKMLEAYREIFGRGR